MGLFSRTKLNRSRQKSFIPPEGVSPVCPHCEQPLVGMFTQQVSMPMGKAWVYFCRRCSKVLGVSHRKGFWMG